MGAEGAEGAGSSSGSSSSFASGFAPGSASGSASAVGSAAGSAAGSAVGLGAGSGSVDSASMSDLRFNLGFFAAGGTFSVWPGDPSSRAGTAGREAVGNGGW